MCLIFFLIATIFRLGLFVRYPYLASGDSGLYDDVYLLERAASILNGEWLGEYNYVTLIKGASFPLFVVLSNLLCMPYSMLLGLFYIASAGIFCYALRYITDNKWAALLGYLYLIFSPISFDINVSQRLYRNAIIFPSVLFVIGCILLVYYKRKEKSASQLPWLALLGVSFSFFYYIREDSFWLLPFFVCALIITAIWYIWFSGYEKKEIIKRCAMLILPICIFLGSMTAYGAVNYWFYGESNINDRSGGSFATLTGNMIRIQDETNADLDFWITRDTLDRITDECPSLTPNKDVIMFQYDAWAANNPQDDGNVRGDWSVWAFREAINRLGVYADAQTQEAFYRKVNDELLTAVEEGRLSFDDALHFTTQSRGIYGWEIPGFVRDTLKNAYEVLTFKNAMTVLPESTGEDAVIRFMDSIMGVKTIWQSYEFSEVRGWLILRDEPQDVITVRLRDRTSDEYLTEKIALYERKDVAEAYPNEEYALYSGFTMELDTCIDFSQTELMIFDGDHLLATTALESQATERYLLNFDYLSTAVVADTNSEYSERSVNVGNGIIQMYKRISPILLTVGLAGYIFCWISFIRRRNWESFEAVIILTGILLSVAIVEFGVTVFNSWLNQIIWYTRWFYSCGAVPMGQVFVIMSLLYFGRKKNADSE